MPKSTFLIICNNAYNESRKIKESIVKHPMIEYCQCHFNHAVTVITTLSAKELYQLSVNEVSRQNRDQIHDRTVVVVRVERATTDGMADPNFWNALKISEYAAMPSADSIAELKAQISKLSSELEELKKQLSNPTYSI